MAIDPAVVIGARLPARRAAWTPDDVILYHLGLGAGARPTDPAELAYTYEGALQVLPSFGVIPAFAALPLVNDVRGLEHVNPAMLLHGEQDLELHAPLPTSGAVTTSGRIADVWDKGKGAVVVFELTSRDAAGATLCVNRFTCFLRGEGGFGGDAGPAPANVAPERAPDREVACPTLPQQALLYRLSGDRNPLHADPAYAAKGGFDQPILHGLCSYGIACKAAVDAVLGGDASRVARYQARFAGVVFPGETLLVRLWEEGDRIVLAVTAQERDTSVISNAAITLRRER